MKSMVEAVEIEIGSDGVEVCKVVKAVVPCDVDQDPPIPTEYVDEYDIVTDLLCLNAACATKEDYTAALVRLHALLKPGGKIVLHTVESENTLHNPSLIPCWASLFLCLNCVSQDFSFSSRWNTLVFMMGQQLHNQEKI